MDVCFRSLPLDLTLVNKFVEFEVPDGCDYTVAKAIADLDAATAWGTAVVAWYGSPGCSASGAPFAELSSSYRMTATSTLTPEMAVTCIKRLRAVVLTADGAAGTVTIYLRLQNPNVPGTVDYPAGGKKSTQWDQ